MSCYSCGGNPNTFCGECLTDKDTWITLVDTLPDPFMGDLDHLFRTPDGNLYALSPDRTRWIRVNGEAGVDYKAGNGISIASDGTISNTQPNENQTLSFNNRTLSISAGNSVEIPSDRQELSINDRTVSLTGGGSITLPEDHDTVYDDTDVKRRLQALEGKTDNFVSNVVLNREGNKITITYTFVNGDTKKVEFEDKDTIGVAYDDSAIQARVKALENKPDKDTVYNDADIKRRLSLLENKTDSNSTLRWAKAKINNNPIGSTTNIQKSSLFNSDGVRVGDIVQDYLSVNVGANTEIYEVTAVNGDTVTIRKIGKWELRNDKQTISKQGNKIVLSNGGGEVDIPQPNLSGYVSMTEYNKVKGALEKLLTDLKDSGAWKQTGSTVFEGELYSNRHIATGNINIFGGTPDGSSYIRTNNTKTENDLAGG